MKCPECGAETTDAASLCAMCGAPADRQPSVPADPADGAPGGSPGTVLAPATSAGPPVVRARGKRLRVAGGIVAAIAAVPIFVAILLPSFYYHGTPLSLWSDLPPAFSLEPLGVAILSPCAGIVMARAGVSGRRWLAAGMLLAFGTQTFLLFWGTQFGFYPPQKPGSAGITGMAGGLMLAAAGVLGAVGITKDRAAPDQTGDQGISGSPNAY